MKVIDTKSIQKLNRDINKISRELLKVHGELKGTVNKALFLEFNAVRNYIITSMRNTKRSEKSYKRKSVEHHPSLPGNPPAIDTGDLVKSILYDVKNMEARLGLVGGAPHGVFLEKKTNRFFSGLLKIDSAGIRPWLKPAIEANKEKIIKKIQAAIKKQLSEIKP